MGLARKTDAISMNIFFIMRCIFVITDIIRITCAYRAVAPVTDAAHSPEQRSEPVDGSYC